uniref:Ethylmalonyl-CoA decarboxylase n=1 Tax=Phallusia mammillata TaxID=59560 RepID=A0A6F9DKA5_9ASCI|nr:ethylmalonyl-CoA decarboxylase-like [Phallusia mammillata]
MLRRFTKTLSSSLSCQHHSRSFKQVHVDGEGGYSEAKVEETLKYLPGGEILLDLNHSDATAVLQISNVSKRNAFTGNMMLELRRAVNELKTWHEGKAVVICGAENMFCSGSDISAIRAFSRPEDGKRLCMYMHNTMHALQHLPQITLAHVEGNAMGGGAELMTACDFRLMSSDAQCQFVQKKMGLVPGWGGVSRLLQLVGRQTTLKLLLSAEKLNAQRAFELNLVDDILDIHENEVTPNATKHESPALIWAESMFQLYQLDCKLAQSIKLDVIKCRNMSNLEDSYKSEIQFLSLVWGGQANRNALLKSVHGRSTKSSDL